MKVRKIESLKKNVLLVDGLPDGKLDMDFLHEVLFPKGNWKLLGKLKDLTEGQVEPLVKMTWISDNPAFCKFKNYVNNGHGSKSTAKESFLSALEAEGVLLKPPHCVCQSLLPKCDNHFCENCKENKQNVFSVETLVFIES